MSHIHQKGINRGNKGTSAMVTNEDVVDCFRMDLNELNRKVNLWMSDSKRYVVSVLGTRPRDAYSEVSRIRVYQDDYVYLLDVTLSAGKWSVVGFCKPDGELTRLEIEMVRLHTLLNQFLDKESSDPYYLDVVTNMTSALSHLETSHRIYGSRFCWVEV